MSTARAVGPTPAPCPWTPPARRCAKGPAVWPGPSESYDDLRSARALGEPLDVHEDHRAGLQAQPAALGEVREGLVDRLAGGADQLGELLLRQVVDDVD